MEPKNIIRTLKEMAALMTLAGENQFKIRAFENGARTVQGHQKELEMLVEQGRLESLKGIGRGLAEVIRELMTQNKSSVHEKLKLQIPPGLLDILRLPGMGAKRVQALWHDLDIATLGELEYACVENRLAYMKGMGQKQQARLLEAIRYQKKFSKHFLLGDVLPAARLISDYLSHSELITRVEIAGSVRRFKEVVQNIDLVVSAEANNEMLAELLQECPRIESVIQPEADSDIISATTILGVPVILHISRIKNFHSNWAWFSNSADHNEYLKQIARKRGYSWRPAGLFRNGDAVAVISEEDLYRRLGLPCIPPELREGGESGVFPENLIKDSQIRGFFHCHTTASDGVHTLEQMVMATKSAGYCYFGISDHSQSAYYAHGLDVERIHEQWQLIDSLNADATDFHIFKGIESDILPDGRLDYDDEILAGFDFVIASVHNHMGLDRARQTERIVKALENPFTTMLGHPTGRLLLSRAEYPVDLEKVIDTAAANGKIIEINCSPQRLDLDWRWVRLAVSRGVLLSINPDAHSLEMINYIPIGVGIARKGSAAAENILNSRTIREVAEYFTAPN